MIQKIAEYRVGTSRQALKLMLKSCGYVNQRLEV